MKNELNIPQDDIHFIWEVVKKFISDPSLKIYAFGSRVSGKARRNSDLDLIIYTKESIPLSSIAYIKEALEESHLLFKIDLHDYHSLDSNLLSEIMPKAKEMKKNLEK